VKAINRTIIIIPAYNEERAIGSLIAEIRRVVGDAMDIVVINDGSSDNTAGEASQAGAVVVTHPFNMGYGTAIQTGYKYARAMGYDYLVQIDGDGQHDPAFIPRLLEPVLHGTAGLTLGSRFLDFNNYRPPLIRRAGMVFFGSLVSLLIGKRISDPTSGYQAFNRSVIELFTDDSFPCDYPDADVLLTLGLAGFSICEIPVRMFANTSGKTMHSGLKPLYYVFKMLLSMAVTLLRSRGPRKGAGRSSEDAD
jgi:glycosyltransferase involved in cell wall biosynthesis